MARVVCGSGVSIVWGRPGPAQRGHPRRASGISEAGPLHVPPMLMCGLHACHLFVYWKQIKDKS